MRLPVGLLLAPLLAAPLLAQVPERAVRRTIPIPRSMERAFAAGTRDSSGMPGPRYWQLSTDYRIDAKLDPATAMVTGHEVVTIKNRSDSTLRMVGLRLYQNRFSPNVERAETVVEVTGGLTISRFVANGRPVDVATPAATWNRTTIVMVPLTAPIAAGATGTLELDWSFRVPLVPDNERGDRMGRWGNRLFQVAQWYPQVAMYDDIRGWDREPHLGSAEFYNNFGSFDVRLDLPAGWLVGATGLLQNGDSVLTPAVRERLARATRSDSQIVIVGKDDRGAGKATAAGDRLVWHFVADSVADFAWAASNEFVWDATRATIPGKGPIPINLFYLPEHDHYQATGAMARHALEFYSKLWMPYAFPQFTQVDGPEGGMEYPMLTMSGPGFGVTDHEIGHQWWPMMVGVNETQYGWMDEGFNQYMNILSGAANQNRAPKLDSVGMQWGRAAGSEGMPPMMWDGNYAGPAYGFVTYGKAPMMLSALGGVVGDSAVTRAMSEYARAWRFKHPSPWDYMFFMNRALHRDLGWFWYYWLFTTESVDESIASVATQGGRTRISVRQGGEMPAPIVLKLDFDSTGPAIRPAPNAVINGNSAVITYPVDVWFGGRRTYVAELNFGSRRILRITLDPQSRFPDRDAKDNVWPRAITAVAAPNR
ncbi:MAG TPA: M1 family metallopeptidase [Gemmatimonadales bacterium]|nr:M1 family metallopeptidase [Gemmatimonadales bacterium]